jgi:hypothetical protein
MIGLGGAAAPDSGSAKIAGTKQRLAKRKHGRSMMFLQSAALST